MNQEPVPFGGVGSKHPYCQKAGVNPDDLKVGRNNHPFEIAPNLLVNGLIYETSTFNIRWGLYRSFVSQWMGGRFQESWSHQKLKSAVDKLKKERASFLRKKTPENQHRLAALLNEEFNIPLHSRDFPNVSLSPPAVELTSGPSTQCSSSQDILLNTRRKLHNALQRERRHKKDLQHRTERLQQSNNEIIRLRKDRKILTDRKQAALRKIRNLRQQIYHRKRLPVHQGKSISTQCHLQCQQCRKYEEDLEAAMEEGGHCKKVTFLTGTGFNADLVTCVLDLLDHNVGTEHVSPVIAAVLKMLRIECDKLPSAACVRKMGQLRLPLSHLHVGEALGGSSNTTLYSDETSKFSQQYESFLVSTQSGEEKLLGIREMVDKSSESTLGALQEVISDLDRVGDGHSTPTGKKLLASIKNTMSDRANTEKKFHCLLKQYRQSVLPDILPNWKDLGAQEQCNVSTLHNFFCGLHILVNMADMASVTLGHYEEKLHASSTLKLNRNPSPDTGASTNRRDVPTACSSNPKEAHTVQLIRAACKAFSRGGDEKSGCYGSVSIFLRSRHIDVSLTRFKGNRFNILFLNAANLYYLHEHLLEFLETWHHPSNLLLGTIARDLQDSNLVAGCRALGLISKMVTGPLWREIEKRESVLQMNNTYQYIVSSMSSCDLDSLLVGEVAIMPGWVPDRSDKVLVKLITPADNDVVTKDIILSVFSDFTGLLKRLVHDQLPGGENWDLSSGKIDESQSCLRHNKLPETVFAQLDWMEHHKPSATALTHESAIMFRFNRVAMWLEDMEEEERNATLRNASALRNITLESFRARHSKMKEEKFQALLRKKEENDRRKREAMRKKMEQTNEIVYHGLWQSSEQVDDMLATYGTKKEKTEALKAQIRFRKNVLRQKPSAAQLVAFSKGGKAFPCSTLEHNLKVLISEAALSCPLQETSFLVRKLVKHTFTTESGVDDAFTGKVISQVPGYPKWYNIVYEGEPEVVYTYQLEDDLEKGFLRIIE